MKLSTKEVVLCVGSGLLISLIGFVIAFFVQPTLITKEGFYLTVGLLPMVLITGIYMNRKEAKERKDDEEE